MITRLNHLALRAADPGAAAAFASEKMGFTLAHTGEDGSVYLKAHGVDPFSLVYVPGDAPGLDHVSYLVKDAAALEDAARHLESNGVAIERSADGSYGHGATVRFNTPSGHRLDLTTGVHT